jgi:NAD(P)H dehydrogenase (quinone)
MSPVLPTLAVTGVTGGLGGAVARLLAAAGLEQRLLVRDLSRAPALRGAVALTCSYGNPVASREALAGVQTLFMVSAAESADRLDQHRTFVDAARSAGVRHIVYTSFAAAAADSIFTLGRDHYATEQHIRAAGLDFTFLRDNFYLDFADELVGEDGVIRGPAADGRMAAVARSDIARTAAVVLQDPTAHRDRTYELTGPEAISLAEVAALLSIARGRPVTFHDETVPEAYASRRKWGAPDWQNDAWVSTYTAIAAGALQHVSEDITTITGQPPLSLAEWLSAQPARTADPGS